VYRNGVIGTTIWYLVGIVSDLGGAPRYNSCYTSVMKTAISIPDAVFDAAEKLTKRLRMSRSELYSKAIAEYVQRKTAEDITEALNKVYAEQDSCLDPVLARAQSRAIGIENW
jgi:predicted transcriptional regulator